MAGQQIVFFDIPSKVPEKSWSINAWKTRLLLNYKGLHYTTEWLEYPEIRTRLEKHVLPNRDDTPYTIPTIRFPDGTYVMGGFQIAKEINERYPEPRFLVESRSLIEFRRVVGEIWDAFRGNYLLLVHNRVLNEASTGYFRTTREEDIGMTLEQFEKEQGGEQSWSQVGASLQKVTAMLKDNAEGPFFEGKEISYIDSLWVAFLISCRRLGEDVFQEVLERSGDTKVHTNLLEAVEPWIKRSSY
ncbi:putative glutathione S-transferase [Lasiosphaeria hispida]|uniref:Glutathione S-transferase n=1 Tax=Lasiosphaeria hispida TaxID=260671 RepID=A0AAJ0HA39_9PEZI|nr:putative glutathione S-transferase [Lasiosphaeria hispida]